MLLLAYLNNVDPFAVELDQSLIDPLEATFVAEPQR
jgi:hypothetical protein